jgi:23S rRNA pseudouridine1911/1915/1917 synthase
VPKTTFRVTETEGPGRRIDAFLAGRLEGLSRSHIQQLIGQTKVMVDGRAVKASHRLAEGETIEIEYSPIPEIRIQPQAIPLDILFQDRDIIIVDKPSGLVVHPGAGRPDRTLVQALLFHFPDLQGGQMPDDRPGIVHRLDKETSGVMVVARSPQAFQNLQQQFKARDGDKAYLGLVWGRFRHSEGEITWAIGRHSRRRDRMSIKTEKPRAAETRYRLLKEYPECSYLEIRPRTGRTHQIRVHMSAAGHPLMGDSRYGRKGGIGPSPRLFLHAHMLSFRHPGSGKTVRFTSPLPHDLQAVLDGLQA